MGHNSGDSIGGNIGPSAGSGGINKRHRGSPRNAAKNSAGQHPIGAVVVKVLTSQTHTYKLCGV